MEDFISVNKFRKDYLGLPSNYGNISASGGGGGAGSGYTLCYVSSSIIVSPGLTINAGAALSYPASGCYITASKEKDVETKEEYKLRITKAKAEKDLKNLETFLTSLKSAVNKGQTSFKLFNMELEDGMAASFNSAAQDLFNFVTVGVGDNPSQDGSSQFLKVTIKISD